MASSFSPLILVWSLATTVWAIWISSALFFSSTCTSAILISSTLHYPSKCARNLGSYLDENLSMKEHVSTAVRSVYWNIRSVGKIRRYLDGNTCASLLNALVTSRLDYNNSLLFGVPDTILNMLQAVQNHAARILTGTRMSDHITPVLISLHWL